jgi:hypothetical protein
MVDPRATSDPAPALPAPPDALVAETWILHPPEPGERSALMRPEAAALVDGLLVRVARGHAALDVAIGEQLDALSGSGHLMRLGYSSLGDYARARLGIEATTSRNLAKLARELRTRPLLREAVRSGEVTARKAQVVLPVARGEAEAAWVERGRRETVRGLEVAVREARCGTAAPARRDGAAAWAGAALADRPYSVVALAAARELTEDAVGTVKACAAAATTEQDEAEERWERISIDMAPEDRAKLDRAMAIAGRVLGPGAPRWERLEAICQEYLGEHPTEVREDERSAYGCERVVEWLAAAKEALEQEMNRWDFLEEVPPVAAPVDPERDPDLVFQPLALDARLRELAAMRARWDVLLGHHAMLMKTVGLWRDAGFASFAHYGEQRLGMSARALEQRAALAKRSYELPGLREAMWDGRVSYEKARLVARVADEDTIPAWLERARATTAVDLRREIEEMQDAQMCARGELVMTVPRRVRVLVDAVVRAAREAEERWVKTGEALGLAAEHYAATWEPLSPRRRTRSQRILERDRGRCLVPGCSRPAAQAHHLRFRSAGGTDADWNLGGLCIPHHLHGVHGGWIEVTGRAPGRLVWRMVAPPAPLA